jgi:hypothetical protein
MADKAKITSETMEESLEVVSKRPTKKAFWRRLSYIVKRKIN